MTGRPSLSSGTLLSSPPSIDADEQSAEQQQQLLWIAVLPPSDLADRGAGLLQCSRAGQQLSCSSRRPVQWWEASIETGRGAPSACVGPWGDWGRRAAVGEWRPRATARLRHGGRSVGGRLGGRWRAAPCDLARALFGGDSEIGGILLVGLRWSVRRWAFIAGLNKMMKRPIHCFLTPCSNAAKSLLVLVAHCRRC